MVERGQTFEITDRGRPVALLTPLPDGSPLDQLRLGGEIEQSVGDIGDLPAPLPSQAAEPPSAVLARLRHEER